MRRLVVRQDGIDVSDDVEIGKGKANPFGWSVMDILHNGQYIGELYCGVPKDVQDGYVMEIEDG